MPSESVRDEQHGLASATGLRARWSHVPRGWKGVFVAAALIVLAGALVELTSVVTEGSSPEGPASSSFSPTGEGLEGYAQLLSRNGDHVTQLTAPLSSAQFSTGTTVIVADPTSWETSGTSALSRLLDSGGRVVVAGQPPPGLLESLVGSAPTWSPLYLSSAASVGSSQLVYGVSQVDSTGPGAFTSVGDATPVLAAESADGVGEFYLALSAHVAAGTLVLVATPAPFQNRLLAQADNAAFGIDAAGRIGSSVVFDEYDHGYGRAGGGLGGLPTYWKAGLWLLFIAILVWMLSAIRRFGPPQSEERELAPPRVQYVDSMARVLSGGSTERLAPVTARLQARARETLSRRSGALPGSSDIDVREAAVRSGFDEHLVDAVLNQPHDAEELVAVGRACAELASEDRL